MKHLCPKGKGKTKIQPASVAPPLVQGSSSSSRDALSVLKLLPAAILALTMALTSKDKEVLAYLITQSMAAEVTLPTPDMERRRCWDALAPTHQSMFGCSCFNCYTSFWSRWDSSPDCELIHQAIEAFEDHLLCSNKKHSGGKKRRRRERKVRDRTDKGKKENVVEKKSMKSLDVTSKAAIFSVEVNEAFETTKGVAEVGGNERKREDEAASSERRRFWSDLIRFIKCRFLSLWSPK
ncbi:hypothetical protein Cni_G21616 [Canna indica]|uniref:Uncharacterized protein n=1 Tax=Canna indica TaxID=4628 RepID=A0AAQ3KTG0_9LILI|nr:hypothetical protein Cni_G21616 [Canna indica]